MGIQAVVREAYAQVQDLISETQFRANVQAVVEAWGGLMDDRAASLLVAAQLGRDVVEYGKVAELQEGLEATVKVVDDELTAVREFSRQDGRQGRVVNVLCHDASGACRLVLWDEDVDLPARLGLRPEMPVRLIDCFVRRTNFGLEVGRGKFGRVLPA